MLNYYISIQQTTSDLKKKIVKLQLLHLLLISIINYIKNNQTKELKASTIFPTQVKKKDNNYASKSDLLFNNITTFLAKKTTNKQNLIKYFTHLSEYTELTKKKTKKRKNIIKKITPNFWKIIKKTHKKKLYKPIINDLNTSSFLKNFKKSIYINNFYKNYYKNYKKKNKKYNFRENYNSWIKKKKHYFYVTGIKKNYFFKKIINLNKLINWLFLNKFKKQFKKIINKKLQHKKTTKIRIMQSTLLQVQQTTLKKITLEKAKNKGCFINNYKNKIKLNLKQNKPNPINLENFVINIKTLKFYFKIQNKKKINKENLNTKTQIKKLFFNSCFNTTKENLYNINNNPNLLISSTPQLIINTLQNLKQKKYNDNFLITLALQESQKNIQTYKTTLLINTISKKLINNNITNNYLPIFFFKTNNNNSKKNNNYDLTGLTTKLYYYYNINTMYTTKYQTFFVFFILNFLELFLKKKIWVRINTRDTIPFFWKNHINLFLYNNLFLYKKFNKLITIRELLEILWLTFKNHDLQILLFFMKRKLENSHFKKHKKILSIFFDILRKNEFIFNELKIKGFFFDIRGKVGVSGNAKKRHQFFSIGKISTTSQNLGSYFQQISVWTPTGQMGITCVLQY